MMEMADADGDGCGAIAELAVFQLNSSRYRPDILAAWSIGSNVLVLGLYSYMYGCTSRAILLTGTAADNG